MFMDSFLMALDYVYALVEQNKHHIVFYCFNVGKPSENCGALDIKTHEKRCTFHWRKFITPC